MQPSETAGRFGEQLTAELAVWRLTSAETLAGVYWPWVEVQPQILHDPGFPPAVQHLLRNWLKLNSPAAGLRPTASAAERRSLKLRRLMRWAYLDLPTVVLAVAFQRTLWLTRPEALNWAEIDEVYLPLCRMLGLWEWRRAWTQICAEKLHGLALAQCQRQLRPLLPAFDYYARLLRQHLQPLQTAGQILDVAIRRPQPASVLYRERGGAPLDDLLNRMAVEIEAPTVEAGYALLGPLHRLGRVMANQLKDSIAQPLPNGYRALHTDVVLAAAGQPYMRVEFRLRTPIMAELNRDGLLAYREHPERYGDLTPWWQPTPDNAALRAHLAECDIADDPLPEHRQIYVFTPRGEVKHLPCASTALDLAYQLHTDLGHHCRAVQINSVEVQHGAQLRNGDLVQIITDPFFNGPDPRWLQQTRNPATRNKIKRGMGAHGRPTHPARHGLMTLLSRLEEQDRFVIPEQDLELALTRLARARRFSNLRDYLDASDHHGEQPSVLAARVLQVYLGEAVLTAAGEAVRRQADEAELQFCAACLPVPAAPLVLHRRMSARGRERLTLHRAEHNGRRPFCIKHLPAAQLDAGVRWAKQPEAVRVSHVSLAARDRQGLVGEVLARVYAHAGVYLTRVEATADTDDRTANLLLTLTHQGGDTLLGLMNDLLRIDGVIKASDSPGGGAAFTLPSLGALRNPYTSGTPVRDPAMFFGRQRELGKLRDFLSGPHPEKSIILHGQRRVGKTSLALRLQAALGDLNLRWVYVDLQYLYQSAGPLTFAHVAHEIGEACAPQLPPAPARPAAEPWTPAHLRDYLRTIIRQAAPGRLVLILDEFNLLVDRGDPGIFYGLKALLSDTTLDLSMILLTHTTKMYGLPHNHAAGAVYTLGPSLEIVALDEDAARQLVRRPLEGQIKLEEAVVNQIVRDTGGNAYLLNIVCSLLLQHLTQAGRTLATTTELRPAVDKLLREGETYFAYLTDALTPPQRRLLHYLGAGQASRLDPVELAPAARLARLKPERAAAAARELAGVGILEFMDNPDDPREVRLTVEYFRQWLRRQPPPSSRGRA